MPFVTIPADTWTAVQTTTEDTVFQNRGGRNVYLTTVATGGLAPAEGLVLEPNEAVVVVTGKTVSVSSPAASSQIFYVGI